MSEADKSNLSEEEIIIECNKLLITLKKHHINGSIIQVLYNLYNKEKETSHFLQSELDRANAKILEEKEKNEELKKDISEMYYKGVVLDILQDELNISRDEAIEILEDY